MRKIDADEFKLKLSDLIAIYESRMPAWSPNDFLTSGKDAAMKYGAKADGVEKALELLERMPAVETEPAKWISTEEELPPKGCEVLVCDFDDYTAVGFFNGCKWVVDGFEASTPPVSHWQPLPKPPRRMSKTVSSAFSFECSSCKHEMNCKDREKCGRENGSGYEPFNPVRSLEKERFFLTKCAEIIKHYGVEPQKDIFVEECAELIQAVEKSRRMEEKPEYTEDMIEEMADVQIMLWQFRSLLNGFWDECFENKIMAKLRRQFDRIENEKEDT